MSKRTGGQRGTTLRKRVDRVHRGFRSLVPNPFYTITTNESEIQILWGRGHPRILQRRQKDI